MNEAVPSKSAERLLYPGADVTSAVDAIAGSFDSASPRLAGSEPTYRCYRYALRPTPVQAQAIARASDRARRVWNELCALMNWAEQEQRYGRREALLHAYGRLLEQKKRAGKAITKA